MLIVFLLASLAFGMWLFASLNRYGMAYFDCADRAGDQKICSRAMQRPIEIKAAIGSAIWLTFAGLLVRMWKRA